MERIHVTTCPVCGASKLSRVLTCVDHAASGEMYHLCRCDACSFTLTQDFPAEPDIERYYRTPDYISHTDTRRGLTNRLYHRVRERMLKTKARLVMRTTHREVGRLLDIGAGTGYFADYMTRLSWNVEAVERSADARRFAHEHFGLDVKPADELDRLVEQTFDVVTLWHVMEHLQSLNETWERLRRLLRPGGVVIVAVPNCSSFDARKYGAYWAAYDVPRHLWHFTPDTMQRLALRHGFVMTERRPMPFDAFYVSILTERYMRHNLPFVRGMVTGTVAYIASLAKRERSSSMIYCFRMK